MARVRHEVKVVITQECDDEPMSEHGVKAWVEHHFEGCEYGRVQVASVTTSSSASEHRATRTFHVTE